MEILQWRMGIILLKNTDPAVRILSAVSVMYDLPDITGSDRTFMTVS